jgi:hypothetical protein
MFFLDLILACLPMLNAQRFHGLWTAIAVFLLVLDIAAPARPRMIDWGASLSFAAFNSSNAHASRPRNVRTR